MTKCSECGYENMDGLDYCDGCGAKLAHPAEGAPAPDAEPAPAAAPSAAPETKKP
jgi:methionyl-tRNA synthetase